MQRFQTKLTASSVSYMKKRENRRGKKREKILRYINICKAIQESHVEVKALVSVNGHQAISAPMTGTLS